MWKTREGEHQKWKRGTGCSMFRSARRTDRLLTTSMRPATSRLEGAGGCLRVFFRQEEVGETLGKTWRDFLRLARLTSKISRYQIAMQEITLMLAAGLTFCSSRSLSDINIPQRLNQYV